MNISDPASRMVPNPLSYHPGFALANFWQRVPNPRVFRTCHGSEP